MKQGILRLIHTEPKGLSVGSIYKEAGTNQLFVCSVDGITGTYPIVLPIIVTDDAIVKDDYMLTPKGTILKCEEHNHAILRVVNEQAKKILVLPEQIPQNIIDAIAAGKLKDGDVVNVETYLHLKEVVNNEHTYIHKVNIQEGKVIVSILDKISNEVVTEYYHPAEKMYTREEVIQMLQSIVNNVTDMGVGDPDRYEGYAKSWLDEREQKS